VCREFNLSPSQAEGLDNEMLISTLETTITLGHEKAKLLFSLVDYYLLRSSEPRDTKGNYDKAKATQNHEKAIELRVAYTGEQDLSGAKRMSSLMGRSVQVLDKAHTIAFHKSKLKFSEYIKLHNLQ
jgi:hypothetical protein